jgi:hypothetical protein
MVKYYNQEATRFGLFTLHQASILCKQTEPTNTRHQCESNSSGGHLATDSLQQWFDRCHL